MFSSESELESEGEEQRRIGNTDWCQYGECKPVATYTKNLCCQDANEVPEEQLEGQKCITKSSGFQMVCLKKKKKQQYYILHYQLLNIYTVILWKI